MEKDHLAPGEIQYRCEFMYVCSLFSYTLFGCNYFMAAGIMTVLHYRQSYLSRSIVPYYVYTGWIVE